MDIDFLKRREFRDVEYVKDIEMWPGEPGGSDEESTCDSDDDKDGYGYAAELVVMRLIWNGI